MQALTLPLKLLPCEAPFYLRNGHTQTIASHYMKSPKAKGAPEIFEVAVGEGDTMVGHYYGFSNRVAESPVIVSVFHGLSGDANSDYMQRTAVIGQQLGCSVVLWNHRGAGQGVTSKKPYNSGSVEDCSLALEFLRKKFPEKKQIIIGFSLSANITLAWLGGYKNKALPDAAIAVNAPINLENSSLNLAKGFNRIYDLRFVNRLKPKVKLQVEIPRLARLFDFDEIYTAPASGFRNREHYYAECSANQYIPFIKTPTYVLTSKDDPFVDYREYLKISFPETVQLHIEAVGGHMGYISPSLKQFGGSWLDYYLHTAISAHLKNACKK